VVLDLVKKVNLLFCTFKILSKIQKLQNKETEEKNKYTILYFQVDLWPGSEIYFDNLFTSFPLLDKLSEMQLAGTGTVRQNKLFRVPIINKKDLEKQARGTSEVLYQDDKVRLLLLFSLFEYTVQ